MEFAKSPSTGNSVSFSEQTSQVKYESYEDGYASYVLLIVAAHAVDLLRNVSACYRAVKISVFVVVFVHL
jgi:hypothetical protein